jgi:hypothetical protein
MCLVPANTRRHCGRPRRKITRLHFSRPHECHDIGRLGLIQRMHTIARLLSGMTGLVECPV